MEQSCCCPPADSTSGTAFRCPKCDTNGTTVDLLTVKALLTEHALRRLAVTQYRFCADAGCEVVYFNSAGHTFTTTDVRVPVWQKQPFGQRMVCYCFDENEAAIQIEIEQHGQSEAAERVRQHIGAGRCACEVRNPRGSCCLGDVTAAVTRLALAVRTSQGK
jgi:Zinc binding domain